MAELIRGRDNSPTAMVRRAWSHPSNRGARVRALARCAYHFGSTRLLKRSTTVGIGSAMRVHVNPGRPASSRAVYANPPDLEEMLIWRRVIRPADTVIDVGANIGLYTLLLADLGAEVIAVEPMSVDELRRNIALNSLSVRIIEAAVSNETGTLRFSTGKDQENAIVQNEPTTESREVDSIRLDDVIGSDHIRGVKIDVEGFERLVLEGMPDALRDQRVDLLQLEWNRQSESALNETRVPAAELLLAAGYRLGTPRLDGTLAPTDGEYGEDDSIDIFAVSPRLELDLFGSTD